MPPETQDEPLTDFLKDYADIQWHTALQWHKECIRSKYSINTFQDIHIACSKELSCMFTTTSHYKTKPITTKTTITTPINNDIKDTKIPILQQQKKTNNQSPTKSINYKFNNQQQLQQKQTKIK